MRVLFLLPVLVALFAAVVFCLQEEPPDDGDSAAKPPPEAEAFQWTELILRADAQPAGSAARYLQFLERGSLSAGVYRLRTGEEDLQQPHDLDEVYYVVKGHARFRAGSEDFEAKPGAVLFVAAGVEHRFHGIVEDLELLVFFSKAPL